MSRDCMSTAASSSSSSLLFSSNGASYSSSSSRPQHDATPMSAYSGGTTTTSAVRQIPPSGRRVHVTPRRLPLVLDPSSSSSTTTPQQQQQYQYQHYPRSVVSEGSHGGGLRLAGGATTVRKILQAATSSSSRSSSSSRTQQQQLLLREEEEAILDGTASTNQLTAVSFARTAPRAGFLFKLGSNIPEFKRRFFVLKPSTHLYYFVSPHDTEPRGCIDLEGATIGRDMETLPDGRFRFCVLLGGDNNNNNKRVVLEARSQEVGKQWMESMKRERLSFSRAQQSVLEATNAQYEAKIAQLEKQLDEYKLVERDRDGALEDAANWKSQFERLNEGLRLLTQHLRRPPTTESPPNDDTTLQSNDTVKEKNDAEGKDPADTGDEESGAGDKLPVESTNEEQKSTNVVDETGQETPKAGQNTSFFKTPQTTASHREQSLLDEIGDEEQQIDDLEFPGTHFSTLLNACQQLRESVRFASIEASSAVEDLNNANEKVSTIEKRMAKAEKHICKLWEENCAMRKTLKQNKAEKRVLVKEVKSLMAVVNETSQKLKQQAAHADHPQKSTAPSSDDDDGSRNFSPTAEERLIDELEEHVMTSIRLHEQFLGVNSGLADQLMASVQKIESGAYDENDDETKEESLTVIEDSSMQQNEAGAVVSVDTTGESEQLSPIKPTLLALFDEVSDDDDDDDESADQEDRSRAPSFISSVGAEFGDAFDDITDDGSKVKSTLQRTGDQEGSSQVPLRVGLSSSAFTPLVEENSVGASNDKASTTSGLEGRKHPILRLDEEMDEEVTASSTQSESTQSIITDNRPTSRLFCPLADVVATRKKKDAGDDFVQDGKVYHLTFYSRKIGIQFQKVPPPEMSRGLLTEAMTADMSPVDGNSTAADLRRVAAISNLATATSSAKDDDEFCQVATPVDAVLVCGFHGFDDKANHVRPNLGARLVAFDGISVEAGRWTFESVRKAIQARGRPLTLSFRNDFLTTKQRAILTKAVADVGKALPPPRRSIQYKRTHRPPSVAADSIMSTQSHETDQFVNNAHPDDDDDLSVSVASSARTYTYGKSFSGTQSVESTSNYRSFSEAGSSSIISSSLGPLVGNLMTGLSKKRNGDVPSYLRSDAQAPEHAPYHQDFTANLL